MLAVIHANTYLQSKWTEVKYMRSLLRSGTDSSDKFHFVSGFHSIAASTIDKGCVCEFNTINNSSGASTKDQKDAIDAKMSLEQQAYYMYFVRFLQYIYEWFNSSLLLLDLGHVLQ